MRLTGKVAIVTGAGSGFGETLARRFSAEGAGVVVNDIRVEEADRVAAAIVDGGGKAVAVAGDVTRKDDWQLMVDRAEDDLGPLTTVVNNAGITHRNGSMLSVDEDLFDRVYAVNVKSLYWSAQATIPQLRGRAGCAILNIASTAAVRPRPGLVWYNGTKGAAVVITKSMALELAGDGIRVNAINPVLGQTGLTDLFVGDNAIDAMAATIPLGRLSTPEDVATAGVFLCSDEASFLTGVCLPVDGGRCV